MTVIDLLFSYHRIRYELEETIAEMCELQHCKEQAYGSIQSSIGRFGQAPLPQGRVGNPTAQQAIMMCDHYEDKLERLEIKRRGLQSLIETAHNLIGRLTEREQQIVTLRFFERKQWHDICAIMKISSRTAHYARQRILNKFSDKKIEKGLPC